MSAARALPSLTQELAAITGAEFVNEDAGVLRVFAVEGVAPAVTVSPGSAEEIAAILRLASARGLVVIPCGGFTHQQQGGLPERGGILLKTVRLRALRHYDPGDLTFGADAGITLEETGRALAEHGQFLPLEVVRPQAATLGGALAVAAQGPLSHAYGGVRDFCIGVTFVTGDGKIAQGGGRVVKNVAGYDLMKLL
ncbi:MAG: FAD-binding oxidoreductase, partial [Terriglobales bacterium]